jgi:hypothetical protein
MAMTTFNENLAQLASVDHLSQLDLLDSAGKLVASIENKPGSQGSLKVYSHLAVKWGCLKGSAAKEGILLYAEHAEDARLNPGKQPNIDRLLEIIASGTTYSVHSTPFP